MDRKQTLQRKLSSQKLRNRLKQCFGFEVIETIDNDHELVQRYKNEVSEIVRNSWPVYASTEYSNVFDDNLIWFEKILPFQEVGDEWLLTTISWDSTWWIHIKILDYRQTMRELWWEEHHALTAIDLSNQLVFDIGINETLIEVRLNYLKK